MDGEDKLNALMDARDYIKMAKKELKDFIVNADILVALEDALNDVDNEIDEVNEELEDARVDDVKESLTLAYSMGKL